MGSSVLQIQQFGTTALPLQVQDDLSKLRRIEYFVDKIGRDGTGQSLAPLDGCYDERIEETQILLNNNFNGIDYLCMLRMIVVIGVIFTQSQSVANYRKFLITLN